MQFSFRKLTSSLGSGRLVYVINGTGICYELVVIKVTKPYYPGTALAMCSQRPFILDVEACRFLFTCRLVHIPPTWLSSPTVDLRVCGPQFSVCFWVVVVMEKQRSFCLGSTALCLSVFPHPGEGGQLQELHSSTYSASLVAGHVWVEVCGLLMRRKLLVFILFYVIITLDGFSMVRNVP